MVSGAARSREADEGGFTGGERLQKMRWKASEIPKGLYCI